MRILFKKIREDAITPIRVDKFSAGWDLSIPEKDNYVLAPGERKLIKLGFCTELSDPIRNFIEEIKYSSDKISWILSEINEFLPDGFQVEIRPRSGNALKKGLTVLNTPGTIDSNYRGEWGVILLNTSNEDILLNGKDKIAQAVLMPFYNQDWIEIKELKESDRGQKGFGSTDK